MAPIIPGGGPILTRVITATAQERRDEFDALLTELEGLEQTTPDTAKSARVKEILGLLKKKFNVDVAKGTILVGTTPHKVEVYAGSKWVKARELPSYAERAKLLFAHVDLFTQGLKATKGKAGATFEEGRGEFEWTKTATEEKLSKATITAGDAPLVPTWAGRFRQIFTLGQQSAKMPGKKASTDLVKEGAFISRKFEQIAESVQDLGVNLLGVQHPTDRLRDMATDVAVQALESYASQLEILVDVSNTPPPVKEMYQGIESLGRLPIPPNLLRGQTQPTGGAATLVFLRSIVQNSRSQDEIIEAKSLLQRAFEPLTKALVKDRSWQVSISAYDLTKIDETASKDKLKDSLSKALDKEMTRQSGLQEDAVIPIWANWALANKDQLAAMTEPTNPRIKSLFDALKAFAERFPPLDVEKDYEEIKGIFQPLIKEHLNLQRFNRHIVTDASGNRAINHAALESTLQEQLGRYILAVGPSQPLPTSATLAPKRRGAVPVSSPRAAQAASSRAVHSSTPSIPTPLTDSELSSLPITSAYKNALAKSVKDWVDLNSDHLTMDMHDDFKRAVTDLGFDNGALEKTNRDNAIKIIIKHLSLPGQLISIEAVPEALNRIFPPPEAVAPPPLSASSSAAGSIKPLTGAQLAALSPSPNYIASIKSAVQVWAVRNKEVVGKFRDTPLEMAILGIASDLSENEAEDLNTIIKYLSKPKELIDSLYLDEELNKIFSIEVSRAPEADLFSTRGGVAPSPSGSATTTPRSRSHSELSDGEVDEGASETGNRDWMPLPPSVSNPGVVPRRDSLESTGSTGSASTTASVASAGSTGSASTTNTNVDSGIDWVKNVESSPVGEEGDADAGRPRSSSGASSGSAETSNTNTEGAAVPPPTGRGDDDGKKPSGP